MPHIGAARLQDVTIETLDSLQDELEESRGRRGQGLALADPPLDGSGQTYRSAPPVRVTRAEIGLKRQVRSGRGSTTGPLANL